MKRSFWFVVLLLACDQTQNLGFIPDGGTADLPANRDGTALVTPDLAGVDLAGVDFAGAGSPDLSQPSAWMLAPSMTTTDLYSVWVGPGDVFAVGGTPGMATNSGVIVRYTVNGNAWSTANNGINLLGVAGSGSTAIAVGELGLEGSDTLWNGSMWSSRNILAPGYLRGVFETTDGGDLYIVGDQGTLVHCYTGGSTCVKPTNTNSKTLNAVWGSSGVEVYAVGAGGTVLHSANGTSFASSTSSFAGNLTGVWGGSASDVYIVGNAATGSSAILHSTNGGMSWTTTLVDTFAQGAHLNGVWGSSSTDVYVVGTSGGVVGTSGGIFHSSGGDVWTTETIPQTGELLGIGGGAPFGVYAVGRGGAILHK